MTINPMENRNFWKTKNRNFWKTKQGFIAIKQRLKAYKQK
jgi:hypothetical protein